MNKVACKYRDLLQSNTKMTPITRNNISLFLSAQATITYIPSELYTSTQWSEYLNDSQFIFDREKRMALARLFDRLSLKYES